MRTRPVIITGNWKMYKTIEEGTSFLNALFPLVKDATAKVWLAVPFTHIRPLSELAKGTNVEIGAQNMHDATEGAFTGEIAAKMLKEAGATFVILGHSERRRLFQETNQFVNRKVKKALAEGLRPVVCIGENLQDREAGQAKDILRSQLTESLADLSKEQIGSLVLAYEPVWAVGTDQPASPEIAEEIHRYCRSLIAQMADEDTAEKLVIQYGGSVTTENARGYLDCIDIDGLLVGGASLSPETFSKIVKS